MYIHVYTATCEVHIHMYMYMFTMEDFGEDDSQEGTASQIPYIHVHCSVSLIISDVFMYTCMDMNEYVYHCLNECTHMDV